MPAISASAPGKVILFGEHAVVYDRPALAVPVTQVQARVSIMANPTGQPGQVWITAKDTNLSSSLSDLPSNHPFSVAVQGVLEATGVNRLPAMRLQISSTIPIAAGLGSGAAVSVALARALSSFLGKPLPDEKVSAIAFRADQKYHGNPSGIDNTVITYAQPIFFIKNHPFEQLKVEQPFTIVIGNTGITSPTGQAVSDVHSGWMNDQPHYEKIFDEIASITQKARQIIESGNPYSLGPLINRNHELLQEMGVSCDELDHLVDAARSAGAPGAKLVGGGRGGNMIALVHPEHAAAIAEALTAAGAVNTIITTIKTT